MIDHTNGSDDYSNRIQTKPNKDVMWVGEVK